MPRKSVAKKRPRKGTPRTAPCPQHPEWSMARYRTFVRSALRKAWMKWPPKFEALRRAQRPSQSDNKKLKWEYQCCSCKVWFPQTEISVDHIIPWGDPWILSFEEACSRLLVSVDQLQVLCDDCHSRKSSAEREAVQVLRDTQTSI